MRVKCFIDEEGIVLERVREYLMNDELVKKVLKEFTPLICEANFREVYLLRERVKELVLGVFKSGRAPYSAGLYLGRLRDSRPKLIPSTTFLQHVNSILGHAYRALTVGINGLKPFLYGKDVLKASVVGCHPPIIKNDLLAVSGRDGYVYGAAISLINSCIELKSLKKTDPVALRVFDVGWFLREGKEPRERKYTISHKRKSNRI